MRGGRMQRMGATRAAAVMAMVVSLAVVGCGDGGGDPGEAALIEQAPKLDPALAAHLPPGATMEMAESGRRLFVTCSVCHGPDAGGTQLGPSLRDGEWVDISGTPEEIERVIREGVPEPKVFATPMPVMGGGEFDDTQIRDLTAYVYALGHANALPADSVAPDTAGSPS